MAVGPTHRKITLRPPPGTRFTFQKAEGDAVRTEIHGADIVFEYAIMPGKGMSLVDHFHAWVDAYILPEVLKDEAVIKAAQEAPAQEVIPENTAAQTAPTAVNADAIAKAQIPHSQPRAKPINVDALKQLNTTKEENHGQGSERKQDSTDRREDGDAEGSAVHGRANREPDRS